MRDVSDVVAHLFKRSQISQMKEISGDNVIDAMKAAQEKCYTLDDYFRCFSALNLLNAAIKTPNWKKLLTYSFIKGHATRLWTHCIYHPTKGLDFYYNAGENVLYFKIYGVVFSYHNVTRNSKAQLFSEAAEQSPIVWPGIRLQRFPVELWELSMESSHRP